MADNSFNSGELVGKLTWDFTEHGGSRGDIPEPSHGKIAKFRRTMGGLIGDMQEVIGEVQSGKEVSAVEQMRIISTLLERDDSEERTKIITALSELTTIPRPELEKLPFRVQQRFMGWITGIFLTPESLMPAMSS